MRQREHSSPKRDRPSRISPRQRRSRAERDRRQIRWVIVIAVIIVLAVIAIPAYGYYNSFVAPPRQRVGQVNDTTFSLGDLTELTRVYKAASERVGQEFTLASGPFRVLTDMVNNELIRQNAGKLGIAVDEAAIDQEIRNRFYPRPPEGQQVSPDQLDLEYRESLRQFLNLADLSMSDYRDTIRSQLFRLKARDKLSDEIERVSEQVYVHWIKADDPNQAEQIQRRLDQGDEFAQVAEELNRDSRFAEENGEVGWVPRDAFPDLEETLFSLEHGKVSEPVGSAGDIYYIKVTDGPETREVSDEMLNQLSFEALNRWLAEQYATNKVDYSFNSDHYQWLVKRVRESG